MILSITYLVVQHLILFLQRGQKRILGQVIRLREVLLVGSFGLFLQCLDILRQQAGEIEYAAFVGGKGRTLIEVGRVEDGLALESAWDGAPGVKGEVVELGIFSGNHFPPLFFISCFRDPRCPGTWLTMRTTVLSEIDCVVRLGGCKRVMT